MLTVLQHTCPILFSNEHLCILTENHIHLH